MRWLLLLQSAALLGWAVAWFVAAHRRRRNDLADVAWGPSFALATGVALACSPGAGPRSYLVAGLVAVWGLRLALHVGLRNRGRAEDPRYRAWREAWGASAALRSFLQVFLLQAVLALVVLAPVTWVVHRGGGALGALDALGCAVWAVGFAFEAVADRQLLTFRRDPASAGKIMDQGLWRYSRHPNYFGEVLLWWGLYLVALAVPGGWASVVGPATITFLILRVSGIPLLERRYHANPQYEEYRRRTSAFFPWPPRA